MSDSRFSLKGTFSIYGKDFKLDMWLNWYEGDSGIDDRIVSKFRECYEVAYAEWNEHNFQLEQERAAREKEAQERATYERLKAKYGKDEGGAQ